MVFKVLGEICCRDEKVAFRDFDLVGIDAVRLELLGNVGVRGIVVPQLFVGALCQLYSKCLPAKDDSACARADFDKGLGLSTIGIEGGRG
jgi:hypothetical protein